MKYGLKHKHCTMRSYQKTKQVLLFLAATIFWNGSYSLELIIKGDENQLKNLYVQERTGFPETRVSVGKNNIKLENYPNAVYIFSKKGRSNYHFMPMFWAASDTSTVYISIDEDFKITFENEGPFQAELNKVFKASKNIHMGPFPYAPQDDKPLEPVLAMEAKAIAQNTDVITEQTVLSVLLKLSEERGISNWSTEIISLYLRNPPTSIYDAGKLIAVSGYDSLENKIEIAPDNQKYVLIAVSGSWCGPCVKGIPTMRKTYDKVSNKILFVSLWNDPNHDTFLNHHKDKKRYISWPSLWDQYGVMANALKTIVYPTYVLFDPSGKEIKRWEGKFPGDVEGLVLD